MADQFGASQPGDTYYFSLLKINVFGIFDCSILGGSLGDHVYNEGQGKKGGNNVASLLIKELRENNLLRDDEPGKRNNNHHGQLIRSKQEQHGTETCDIPC